MFRLSHSRSNATDPSAASWDAREGALPSSICTISIRRYEDWSAVLLRGELDHHTVAELRAIVRTELALERPVLIDLVGLEFSGLAGIRALAELVSQSGRTNGDPAVEVRGARGQVARLIRLLGAEGLLAQG